MRPTSTSLAALAAAGSAALLLGALGFQYLGHIQPCHLCMYERYVHVALILIGVAALFFRRTWIAVIGTLGAIGSVGLSFYHVGVQQHIFAGPSACTSSAAGSLSPEALYQHILSAPVAQCDEVAWDLWGISMAGWNGIFSLGLVAIWIMAVCQGRR